MYIYCEFPMSHFHLPGTFLHVVACCRSLGSIGLEPSLAWSKQELQ